METYAEKLGFKPAVFGQKYITYCLGDYRLYVYRCGGYVEVFQHGYLVLMANFTNQHQFVSKLAAIAPTTAKVALRQLRIESML